MIWNTQLGPAILFQLGPPMKRADITPEVVRELLDYFPDTGEFRWRRRDVRWFSGTMSTPARSAAIWNARYAGTVAGCEDGQGYIYIGLFCHRFRAHRLAFAHMTGEWPRNDIDHVNLNRADNSWRNLRAADDSQNRANCSRPANNSSGFKGVVWDLETKRWLAAITVKRKRVYLGRYDSIDEAADAYRRASLLYFGEFSRA